MRSLTILIVAASLVRPGLALPSPTSNTSPNHGLNSRNGRPGGHRGGHGFNNRLPAGLAVRAVSPDNTCGTKGVGGSANAYTCPEELPCCSVNGFCGATSAYCMATAGCQADFGSCGAAGNDTTSPDMTCGGTVGYTCPTGLCCSGV